MSDYGLIQDYGVGLIQRSETELRSWDQETKDKLGFFGDSQKKTG